MPYDLTREDEKRLFEWIYAAADRPLDSLSESETAVWTAYLFDCAVQNGGFDKAILDLGYDWAHVLASLEKIGAVRIGEMCKEAAALFVNDTSPIDPDTPFKLWELDQPAKDTLWRLGGEYYDLYTNNPSEELLAKMHKFLKNERLL